MTRRDSIRKLLSVAFALGLLASHPVFATDCIGSSCGGSDYIMSGNVGINTTNPATTLDVNGTIRSETGGVMFPDGTTQTTAASGVPTTYGAVGTYIAATTGNTTNYALGSTIAGSLLTDYSSYSVTVVHPSGTWQFMGAWVGYAGYGLWLRISAVDQASSRIA
jgi:hypothetical protein